MSEKRSIIIAPHPDDEVIGCYEIIKEGSVFAVFYDSITLQDVEREVEADEFCNHFGILRCIFDINDVKTMAKELTPDAIYFPDPHYEEHPLHRRFGLEGYKLLEEKYPVIFYTTNMKPPYIHEVKDTEDKRTLLDKFYPSQNSLWMFDKKYFLFEGYCQYLRW